MKSRVTYKNNQTIKNISIKQTILSGVLFLGFIMTFLTSCVNCNQDKAVIEWIPEESHFVDYEIHENRIKFQYTICFNNNSNEAVDISITAKFNKSDLNNWIKYEDFFIGEDKNGKVKYGTILPKEKRNISYYFEGEYLGGSVNEQLSFPEEIIYMVK